MDFKTLTLNLIQGTEFLHAKFSNNFLRSCFNRILYLNVFPVTPKAEEVLFKIMNETYPSKDFLRQRFNLDENVCAFCKEDIERTEHVFVSCKDSNTLWDDLHYWLYPKILDLSKFAKTDIIYKCLSKTLILKWL